MIVANIMTFGRSYDNRSFEFSVKTNNLSSGSSTSTQFKLPLTNINFIPFNINWGDGDSNFITTFDDPNLLHQYASTGTYNVKCSGVVGGLQFNNTNDRLKLLIISKVDGLDLFAASFAGCLNMTYVANETMISTFSSFAFTFFNCSKFNGNIINLSFLSVNNMNSMFSGCTLFNQNIGSWNTVNVTSMVGMFSGATNFNQNIGSWNVFSVTNFANFMAGKTFSNYSATNYDAILNGWTNRAFAVTGLVFNFNTIRRSLSGTEGRELMIRPNVTVNITNAINNGSGLIRVTATAHGMSTGNKVFISGIVGTTGANGGWNVTVIDANTIDLQGSTFVNTYVSGGTVRTGWGHTVNDGGI